MKFKDNISFITYLTSPDMYGKLAVSMSTESGCPSTFLLKISPNANT